MNNKSKVKNLDINKSNKKILLLKKNQILFPLNTNPDSLSLLKISVDQKKKKKDARKLVNIKYKIWRINWIFFKKNKKKLMINRLRK